MSVEIGDYYKIKNGDYDDGVYRVVGEKDGVRLLRVADRNGNSEPTGELVQLENPEDVTLEEVREPTKSLTRKAKLRARILPLEFQTVASRLKSNPVMSGVSLSLMALGVILDFLGFEPISASTFLLLFGAIGVAVSVSNWYNLR